MKQNLMIDMDDVIFNGGFLSLITIKNIKEDESSQN